MRLTGRPSLEAWKADLAAVGEAWTLRGAADQWSTDVGEKVSGLPGKIAVGPLHSDEIFSGASADAYKGIIPGQGVAITNITGNLTSALSKGLDDTADAINDYNSHDDRRCHCPGRGRRLGHRCRGHVRDRRRAR